MNVYQSVSALVGNTPLLELNNYSKANGCFARILAKLEGSNPAGSAKDRVAKRIIESAEEKGILKKGATIIEPTSGNTGIGLAAIAASKGYNVILTMPDTMSIERQKLISAYGAKVVLTDGKLGMNGAIAKANELNEQIDGSIIAGQFVNPENPMAHYLSTGPEIWEDTDGKVDVFVAGVGTGGTISGVGRYLKEKKDDVKIIAVEPSDSPYLSKGTAGPHKIQGIGAGFCPDNFDRSVCDEIVTVHHDKAYAAARCLAKTEGVLVGISSGAALHAATLLAQKKEFEGKIIVALLPDTGDRYLSTELFE